MTTATDVAAGVMLNGENALEAVLYADEVERIAHAVMDRASALVDEVQVGASLYENPAAARGAADAKRRIMEVLRDYAYGESL